MRSVAFLAFLLVVALVGLGGWKLLRPPGQPPQPDLYAVRVSVLGQDGQPIDGSTVRASVGNEPQRVPGGWEVEIPRSKLPADGEVTFRAVHPRTSGQGSATLTLGADPTPSVEIHLSIPEATVRGTVLAPDGRALAGARVNVSGFGEQGVVTAEGGSFELTAHRPPGDRVRIHVEHPEHAAKDQYCWAGGTDCEIRLAPAGE